MNMKTNDIEQKIKQFANGLDADCIVIVNPKDSDRFYACLLYTSDAADESTAV